MSEIKERPTLFNGDMVCAILDGRKTVTRRVIKMPLGWEFGFDGKQGISLGAIQSGHPKRGKFGAFIRKEINPGSGKFSHDLIACHFGQPGDRLWVREAWAADAQLDLIKPRDMSHGEPIRYKADGRIKVSGCAMISEGKARSGRNMPRWASRILLEITDVRVERAQDITPEQAIAEGLQSTLREHDAICDLRDQWKALFESDGGSWNANPWVWVISFKRIQP